ncbi:glycoside hydrolase family 108 protein [Tenacibaculum sp. MEBiC06402]|uniref:glycoside hydrolase family 108 protein n=1 Tax=unclassified Tenacibaculum TaxID=2635139 RepID=UPI003B9BD9D6
MADFYLYKETALKFEGGYQKISSDPGNYNSKGELVGTNLGISAKVYESWIGRPPTEEDMLAITKEIATSIFKTWYWDAVRASEINSQAVAENIVDHAINAGPKSIGKIVQVVLNKYFNKSLIVDGAIGHKTVVSINEVNPTKLFQRISQYRLNYYESINNNEWIDIWRNRVASLAKKFSISIEKKKCL